MDIDYSSEFFLMRSLNSYIQERVCSRHLMFNVLDDFVMRVVEIGTSNFNELISKQSLDKHLVQQIVHLLLSLRVEQLLSQNSI